MSNVTKDKIVESVSMDKVYANEAGTLYFNKISKHYRFLFVNQEGKKIYEIEPYDRKITPIFPEQMGMSKRMEQEIFIIKRIQSEQQLSDEDVYFNCTLVYSFPDEARYKPYYFYKCRSGAIYLRQLDSAVCGEAGVNSEWVKRTKIHKCEPNTMISKKSAVFLLNPATNELERKLPESMT